MTTYIVIPTGHQFCIEKIDAGKVAVLSRRNSLLSGAVKVKFDNRVAADAVVRMFEDGLEYSMFRNRTWFWSSYVTAYQGGSGVARMAGASA